MALVLDASSIVNSILPNDRQAAARTAMGGQSLIVPELAVSEALSSLARLERTGELSSADADLCVADLSSMPLIMLNDQDLSAGAWAMRRFLRITDALYVAAAIENQCPLLTADRRLARAVRAQVTDVSVIEI
ncbi:ribonuclease VapC3 [Nocardioides baekrokdamisoli]|uniref:Ribonuclease VapC n=1 Tax=Nocardioides baekrokdamisoli TaxID=1804624 RepID=A0A3G9J3Y5_9ACTN|nr:type II toxin-antitoxin system VapC family toxin [Nocardioides baekrokdamisoli]BBH18348.1 ribonuclease VapC3 [Nocardioides baekrokdamisoli]